jgi:hypothetical protein
MSKTNPTELFAILVELRDRYPQWRFGQMVANLAGWADADIWDVEDEQLLAAAKTHSITLPNDGKSSNARRQFLRMVVEDHEYGRDHFCR